MLKELAGHTWYGFRHGSEAWPHTCRSMERVPANSAGSDSARGRRVGERPRSWLPEPVAARTAEYRALPAAPGRFRWPRARE